MPQEVTDPALIAEFEDREKARRAGVNYDAIAKSRDAQINKRASGSVFAATPMKRTDRGTRGQSAVKGVLIDPVEGFTQMFLHGGNAAQRALGIDPNKSLENTVRGWVGAKPTADPVRAQGVFSDANVAYNDARRKVEETQDEDARVKQGRGGTDWTRIAASLAQPTPAFARAGRLAPAAQAAFQSALQPTDLAPGENLAASKLKNAAGAAVIGQGASKVLGAAGRAAARFGSRAPSEAAQAAQAAQRLGVDVGLGQVTGNRVLSRAAHASSNMVGGGSITRGAQATENQLGQRLEDVAGQIGRGSDLHDVGQAAKNAINRPGGFLDRFRSQADDMYSLADRHAPADIDALGTMQAMTATANRFRNNPELGRRLANTRLMGMAADIAQNPNNPGRLAFSEAQALRSEVGRMMGDSSLINDIPRSELSNVYRALSNDMRNGLKETGNPEALHYFDQAADFWRQGRARVDTLENILGKNTSNEKLGERIAGMGRKDSQSLYELRRSMLPHEWDDVASGIFRNMGEATPGAADNLGEGFSPSRFLTNFNKIQQNERGFNAIFGGSRYEAVMPQLRDLALLSNRLKNNSKLANHSGSGYYGSLSALLGFGLANPVGAAKIVGGNAAFAKAMSSPAFLRAQLTAARQLNRASRRGGRAIEAVARQYVPKLTGILTAQGQQEEQPTE